MIKNFCDLCETELQGSRVNRNNIIVPFEGISIAIAIKIDAVEGDESICEACLFAKAATAKDFYFKLGEYEQIPDMNEEVADAVLKLNLNMDTAT